MQDNDIDVLYHNKDLIPKDLKIELELPLKGEYFVD
jgi:hypothetical protein